MNNNLKNKIDNQQPAGRMFYLLTDHLGSITRLVNESWDLVQELSYDAWGRRRDPSNWTTVYNNTNPPTTNSLISRGYTGHEHLPLFALINMNGRLYDPLLGRMLSPDNFVQSPQYSQGYYRYAYCSNNPLKFIDPSGETYFGAPDPSSNNHIPMNAVGGDWMSESFMQLYGGMPTKKDWNKQNNDIFSTLGSLSAILNLFDILGMNFLGPSNGGADELTSAYIPDFDDLWENFPLYKEDKNGNLMLDDAGRPIEYTIEEIYQLAGLENYYKLHPNSTSCALRISIALIKSGVYITKTENTFIGKDGNNYYLNVDYLAKFLRSNFTIEPCTSYNTNDILNYSGIIIWDFPYSCRHATLWNGQLFKGFGMYWNKNCNNALFWKFN